MAVARYARDTLDLISPSPSLYKGGRGLGRQGPRQGEQEDIVRPASMIRPTAC